MGIAGCFKHYVLQKAHLSKLLFELADLRSDVTLMWLNEQLPGNRTINKPLVLHNTVICKFWWLWIGYGLLSLELCQMHDIYMHPSSKPSRFFFLIQVLSWKTIIISACQRLSALLSAPFDISVLFHQKKCTLTSQNWLLVLVLISLYLMKGPFVLETLFYFSGNKREILKGASGHAVWCLEDRNEAIRL